MRNLPLPHDWTTKNFDSHSREWFWEEILMETATFFAVLLAGAFFGAAFVFVVLYLPLWGKSKDDERRIALLVSSEQRLHALLAHGEEQNEIDEEHRKILLEKIGNRHELPKRLDY